LLCFSFAILFDGVFTPITRTKRSKGICNSYKQIELPGLSGKHPTLAVGGCKPVDKDAAAKPKLI